MEEPYNDRCNMRLLGQIFNTQITDNNVDVSDNCPSTVNLEMEAFEPK